VTFQAQSTRSISCPAGTKWRLPEEIQEWTVERGSGMCCCYVALHSPPGQDSSQHWHTASTGPDKTATYRYLVAQT